MPLTSPRPKPLATPMRSASSLSDSALDAHLANLESWFAAELAEMSDAVAERDRRGRGGYVLTAEAEAYLADHAAGRFGLGRMEARA